MTPSNPLAHVMTPTGRWKIYNANDDLQTLNTPVMFCEPNLEFQAKDVCTHSLRAAGDMALLCVGIDRDIINMVG